MKKILNLIEEWLDTRPPSKIRSSAEDWLKTVKLYCGRVPNNKETLFDILNTLDCPPPNPVAWAAVILGVDEDGVWAMIENLYPFRSVSFDDHTSFKAQVSERLAALAVGGVDLIEGVWSNKPLMRKIYQLRAWYRKEFGEDPGPIRKVVTR